MRFMGKYCELLEYGDLHLATATRDEAIARYYQKMSNRLKHAEQELKNNLVAHVDCNTMQEYAEQLLRGILQITSFSRMLV